MTEDLDVTNLIADIRATLKLLVDQKTKPGELNNPPPSTPSTPSTAPTATMPMVEMPTKSWKSSRTIWGGIITIFGALAPTVGSALGFTVSSADIQSTVDLVSQIATLLGGLLTIYGRVVATNKIL